MIGLGLLLVVLGSLAALLARHARPGLGRGLLFGMAGGLIFWGGAFLGMSGVW